MNFAQHTEHTTEEVYRALGIDNPTAKQDLKVRNAIHNVIVEVLREAETAHAQAVTQCCAADQDMAHKLSNEIKRANEAVIANLSSMR